MKLGLGTVQFGLPYGISNTTGQTSIKEVKKILKIATNYNIKIIDTAAQYGQSEEVLGKSLDKKNNFKIITKISYSNSSAIIKSDINSVNILLNNSLKKLNQKNIYGILIHNTKDIFSKNGDLLFKELINLKKDGFVNKIGFSVYSTEEIDLLLKYFEFDLIQLPINIFDQKLIINGWLKKLKSKNIEIHARSIFLQGLLLMNPKNVNTFFSPIVQKLQAYHYKLKELNISPLQATIHFVKQIKEIDHIIIGINNSKQLLENINAYNNEINKIDYTQFCLFDEKYTNPTKWVLTK
jgi:aryl-alcohol dehydrogenase-like predicted oxidoreductase